MKASPTVSVAFDHDPVGDGDGAWWIGEWQLAYLGETPQDRAHLRATDGAASILLLALRGIAVTMPEA